MAQLTVSVNQTSHTLDIAPETPLLWVLRDHLGLVGTKFGCGLGQCGACTVHLNGAAIRSCLIPVSAVQGQEVTTIEGLSALGDHPVQEAWIAHDVSQCGYCQAGQIMQAAAFLSQHTSPTEEEISRAMYGNLCRCGTYVRIKRAVQTAAKDMKTKK